MLIKNQTDEAEIVDYTAEGQGVAKIEGCAVFVPNAIAGEKCLIRIEKAQKNLIQQEIELLDTIDAPVSKGQRLGTMYIKAGEQVLREIPLVAETAVPKLTFGQVWSRVLQKLVMAS